MMDMKILSVCLTIQLSLKSFKCTENVLGTNVLLNYVLTSGYCVKNLSKLSYSECFTAFKNGNFSFNAMVYRRSFLLCSLCYVSQTLTVKQEPGFVLAHTVISDTSAVNLALNKQTNQSSTYYSASSSLAVDGNRQTLMQLEPNGFACALTGSQPSGPFWWIVDLGQIYSVSKIVIYNRNDSCCNEWLKELEITVGDNENDMRLCNYYTGPPDIERPIVTITCQQPLLGKFVKITKTINQGFSVCEVEVYH